MAAAPTAVPEGLSCADRQLSRQDKGAVTWSNLMKGPELQVTL